MNSKELTVRFNGKEQKFTVRETPYTGIDDLWVEERKHIYLQMIGATIGDDSTIGKARYMATCELVVVDGLSYQKNPMDMRDFGKAQAVAMLPPEIINAIVDGYFGQFKDSDDPKNS